MCCPTTNMASGICPGSAVLPVDFADTTFYFAFTENISGRLPCSWESPIYAACFPAPANICLCLVSSFFFLLPAGFLIRTSSQTEFFLFTVKCACGEVSTNSQSLYKEGRAGRRSSCLPWEPSEASPSGRAPCSVAALLGVFLFFFLQLHFKKFNFTYVYLKRAHELGLGREPALFSGMAYRRDRNYCIVRCMAIVKFHIFLL